MFGKRSFWIGAQVKAKLENENIVEFYPHIGTFEWVVPESEGVVRIGLFMEMRNKRGGKTEGEGRNEFEEFLRMRLGKGYKSMILGNESGIEPKYSPRIKTEKRNIFLVGDAATHVKATSGGGIIQGLLAARSLAKAIAEQTSYEKEWRKSIGKDLWIHLKIREMMDRFSEKDWNRLTMYFSQKKLREVLEREDRDYPTRFMAKLLIREPRLLYFVKFLI
jgi:flavin-dependent dehydrogenase